MAAVNFDVDTDNLRAGVRDMREQLSAMKEGRDALATSVAEVESTWEGPAKEQFSSQFLRDCEEFDSIYVFELKKVLVRKQETIVNILE